MIRNISVSGKIITQEDKQAMIDCINSGEEFTQGSYTKKFERGLADYIGVKYSHFVNSGSSANLLAFMALTSHLLPKSEQIKRGDEVITVAACFPTTIAPIVQYGATPVFIDIAFPTFNVNVDMLEKALSVKTKAVILAHTLGNPFDIDAVVHFCTKHGLWLIEDGCDSLGSEYGGMKTGRFGDISTCSFYPAHHISCGGGGMVFTDSPLLSKVMLSMRDWGRDCSCDKSQDNKCGKRFSQQHGALPFGYDHKYVYSHLGYNLNATNIQAALGCSQMKRLDEFTAIRRRNYEVLLYELIEESPVLMLATETSNPSWFGFPILLNSPIDKNKVIDYLTLNGVQTRPIFAGNILNQPCHTATDFTCRIAGDLRNTNRLLNNAFWVGCHHGLTEDDMLYSARVIREALAQ